MPVQVRPWVPPTPFAVHTEWIPDSSGTIVDRLSYDPWGKRRSAVAGTAWLAAEPGTYLLPTSLSHLTRGFTGHEHLDTLGLIHMNGRVYDPELGRFLSADPVVQFPASTQGLDRYSYVLNNPLSATDPSGHIIETLVAIGAAILGGAAVYEGYCLAATLIAATAGFLTTGTLKGAWLSAVSMAVTFGIGQYVKTAVDVAYQVAAAAVLHGLAQGALAAVQGESFGAAFLAASISSAFGPQRTNSSLRIGERALRVVKAALIGGTVSKIGGGKFGNGAISGAFIQAFNHDSKIVEGPKSDPKLEIRTKKVGEFTESRFVASMDDGGAPEFPAPDKLSRTIDAVKDVLNASLYVEYEVTFAEIERYEVTTQRLHYGLEHDGTVTYGGYRDLKTERTLDNFTRVQSYRRLGIVPVWKVNPSQAVPPSCVALGAEGC